MRLAFAPAQESDIEALFAFNKEQIDRYEDRESIDYEKILAWVRRKIRAHIREYVCVTADGETAGYYYFHASDGKMEIDDLYILPQWRGKGIGTAVIEKCCAEARTPVFLYVFAKNCRAMALYERMGFSVAREVGSTRFIMQRDS